MSSFVNLMDIVYPVGSIYMSTSSISPATRFGGTWNQIKGAVIGATGDNSFAAAGAYGGNLKLDKTQLPNHAHVIDHGILSSSDDYDANWSDEAVGFPNSWSIPFPNRNNTTIAYNINAVGGGDWAVKDGDVAYGQGGYNTNWETPLYASKVINKTGEPFLPYHYAVYSWERTA